MENVMLPIGIAILAGFALAGLLILGVMGVVSFFRAWERGEAVFSASMPRQTPDRSPLHSLEAKMARGELSESEIRQMRDQLDAMLQRRETERQGLSRRGGLSDDRS